MSIIFIINFHTISRCFAPSEKYPTANTSDRNPPKISNAFDIWSLPKTDYSSIGKCQTCFFYNIFLYISKKNLVVSKRGAYTAQQNVLSWWKFDMNVSMALEIFSAHSIQSHKIWLAHWGFTWHELGFGNMQWI